MLLLLLVSSLAGPPSLPPGQPTTHPVPLRAAYATSLRTWTPSNTVLLVTPAQAATVFRQPLVSPRLVASPWAAVGAQAGVGRNTVQLITPTTQPKPATAHPVPRGYAYPTSLRTWVEHANQALLTAPPVQVAKIRTVVITRYAKRPNITALTAQSDVTGSNINATLVPPVGGYQTVSGDWPNPAVPIYPSSLRTWTQSGRLPLLASQPKAQVDQPNPRGYRYPTSLLTWLQEPNPGLLFVAPSAPSHPLTWPNPRGYDYPVSLRTWTLNLLQTTLKDQDQFFGVGGPDYDWPNPLGYAYPMGLRTWTQDATTRLSVAASVRPFDWPNPRGYAYPVSLRTWTQEFSKPLTSAASVRPFDWPNPEPARAAIDLRTIAQSIPLTILEAIAASPSLGVNIDLIVVLSTDGLQLTVCLNQDVDLDVTTNCTIELKVP